MFEKFYKYEIKKRLGRGGMGDVFLAYDTVQKREVALKLVADDEDSEAQEKVQAEKKGAELQHRLARYSEHVPKIHEYGNEDGFLYIDMEYVDGDDLAKLIYSDQLPYYQIPDIGIQICEVLQVAHSLEEPIDGHPIKGIAHGDIKPKNICINKQRQVKLLDFGIAKALSLTRSLAHSVFGSMEYCSPERLKDGELAPAADLWALGAVLYEAVSRKKAFQASTAQGLENRICSGQPPPPLPDHCPKLLSQIIFKALNFNKKDRYQTAAEFKADLEQASQGATRKIPRKVTPEQPKPAANPPNTPVPAPPGQPPNPKKKRVIVAAVASIVFLLLLGIGVNEYKVRADTLELSRDASAANVLHLADLAGLEQRYNDLLKRRNIFDWGLVSIRERFKSGLMGIADRVVNDYRKDKPKLGKKDWTEARESLGKVMQYFPNDSTAKSKAHYFDGLIALSAGWEEKKKGRDGSSNFRDAIRHFNDAMVLLRDWPDPHLGMAMVHSYGIVDVKAASDAMAKLHEMGLEFGAEREHAMKADGMRAYATDLYNRARKRPTLELSELQTIRQMYQDALDHYAQIPEFSKNAQRELTDIAVKIRDIDAKISLLENQE